jgi:hypothetical protein
VVLQLGGWAWGKQLTSKEVICYEMFQSASDGNDSLARTKQWKKDMRLGTWNIRSLCRVGAIKPVVGELEKYKLDLVGVQEVRATGWTIGVLGFDSRREVGIFLFTTASRTALGPTQPPLGTRGSFPGGKAAGA